VFAVLKRVFGSGHVLVSTVGRVRVKMVFASLLQLVAVWYDWCDSVALAIDLDGDKKEYRLRAT
jgi:hypothetical protein